MGQLVEMAEFRAAEARRIVWCLCWSCGHAHKFHGDEVLRDAGSYEEFERRALCLICDERVAVIVQPKAKITSIPPRRTG